MNILTPETLGQLMRYGLVGLALNVAAYLLYLFLTHLGVAPVLVVSTLYPLFMLLSFFLNRAWSFAYRGKLGSNLARYLLAHVGGYLLNIGLLLTFAELLGFPHQIVQAAAILIVAAYLFLVFRWFVYPSADPSDSDGGVNIAAHKP